MGRPAPKFWWDFWYGKGSTPAGIVVQGDWPGGEALEVFQPAVPTQDLDAQVAQATALIADFTAGRKTPPWGRKAPD